MATCVPAVLSLATLAAEPSHPISDEPLRLTALEAIFPGMQISFDPSKKIDDSPPRKQQSTELYFPDALADEGVYTIIGRPSYKAEAWAAEDIITGRNSRIRRLRFKLFQWPNDKAGLLAVLQYDFSGASPPSSCPSIGLIVHVANDSMKWRVKERFLLETVHHHSLQRVELIDLTGSGVYDLVIESAWGGAGVAGSSLQIFDLSREHLDEVLNEESRVQNFPDETYAQVLDIDRTLQARGRRFYVKRTILYEHGKPLRPPHVMKLSYKRGDGVEPYERQAQHEMLAPIAAK